MTARPSKAPHGTASARAAWITALFLLAFSGQAMSQGERDALRVCADPDNLPFSNRAGEGFENRIAQVLADDLDLPLEYAWYPMQMGFARNTLAEFEPDKDRYRCDLIIGTTSGLEVGKTTEPYYHSIYTVVYRPGRRLQGIESFQDILDLPAERREGLRIGLFAGSPVTQQLLRHGLMDQVVSYKHQSGSADVTPGTIIRQDLGGGELDMIIVWGPIGGYFADRLSDCADCKHTEFKVLKIESGPDGRFHYGISMGVRYGEDAWLDTVESLIEDNRDEIDRILREFRVPRVDADGESLGTTAR